MRGFSPAKAVFRLSEFRAIALARKMQWGRSSDTENNAYTDIEKNWQETRISSGRSSTFDTSTILASMYPPASSCARTRVSNKESRRVMPKLASLEYLTAACDWSLVSALRMNNRVHVTRKLVQRDAAWVSPTWSQRDQGVTIDTSGCLACHAKVRWLLAAGKRAKITVQSILSSRMTIIYLRLFQDDYRLGSLPGSLHWIVRHWGISRCRQTGADGVPGDAREEGSHPLVFGARWGDLVEESADGSPGKKRAVIEITENVTT